MQRTVVDKFACRGLKDQQIAGTDAHSVGMAMLPTMV
jgi:hypothetical protein